MEGKLRQFMILAGLILALCWTGSAQAQCTIRYQQQTHISYQCPNASTAHAAVLGAPIPACWEGTGTVGAKKLIHFAGLYGAMVMWGPGCGRGYYDWSDAYTTALYPVEGDPDKKDERINKGKPKCSEQCVGDPINAGTGNKYDTIVEFETADGGLRFDWTYNSLGLGPHSSSEDATVGRNRSHTYSRRVTLDLENGYQVMYLSRADGNEWRFDLAAGEWVSIVDSGIVHELVDNGTTIGWRYDSGNGDQEIYDAAGRLIELRGAQGRVVQLQRDQNNRVSQASDDRGRVIGFSYGLSGYLESLQLPDGASISFSYTVNGDLQKVTHQGGAETSYLYDESGMVAVGASTGALTGVVDETATRFSSTKYDASGRAIETYLAGGADTHTITYQVSGGEITQAAVVYPSGETRTVSFVAKAGSVLPSNLSISCSGCVSSTTAYVFDDVGNVATSTKNGLQAIRYFEDRGLEYYRQDKAVGASSQIRRTQTIWSDEFRFPVGRKLYDAADTLVKSDFWAYNARGQALTATRTDSITQTSRTTTTTYCEAADLANGTCPLLGLVTSVNGPRTDVTDTTTYTYYASDDVACASSPTTCPHRKGDLWKVTDALGRVTETLAYDGAGRVLSMKDANHVVTDFTYHPRGWLTARKVRGTNNASEADDQITAIEYWPTGLVKKVTQPDGAFTAYTYDAAHRLTDIADNAGNTIHYTLDNAGNRTAESTKDAGNTLRRTLSRVYNQLGQLQTAKDAYNHATGFTYDANGNNQTVTDALSRVSDNDYDPLNRLVQTLQDVGGIAAQTSFAYDAQDNLTKVTDPKGLDTVYTYNGFSDLTQLSSPDTGITSYTYDSAGNRQTQTDARGVTATYSYDALNRLTGIGYPTSSLDVAYIYDTVNASCLASETFAIGRLTKMTDSSGNTEYCYDRFGNLTRKRQTTNGQVFTVRYAYTLAGQLQAITYPDGAVVDYVRDGQGRTTEVGVTPNGGTRQVLLNQATYYPFGPVASWTYGNGRTMSRSLNQNYQPVAIQDPNAGGLSLGYEFDEVGNLKKLFNADQSVAKAQYGYDALNRLTDVKDGPTGTVIDHYTYDATGNRTSLTNAGGTTTYTYPTTNHRLTQVGTTPRTYDNAGNTTQIGGTAKEFVYNDANRMSQVKVGGTATMNYQLSGRGEQVRQYLAANNTYTVYNEAGQWVGDYDATGQPIQQAIWLDDLPVGLLAGATTNQKLHYLQPDHLGTPRAVIDTTANTAIWRWDLEGEAFGNTIPNQDPDGNGIAFVMDMRFPGQRYDATSGFNYNYLRNYEASTGRYAESDPVGQLAGMSTFLYVDGNSLVGRDPLGLATDRPGEYCVSGRCGAPPSVGNSWCGESCRKSCRSIFALEIDRLLNSFVGDNSCDIWEYVDSEQQTACQLAQQAGYFRDRFHLEKKLKACLADCVSCPCGEK